MHRIYGTLIEMVAASVFIIPVFFLYNKFIFHNLKQALIYMVLAFYLVAVFALVGFPSIISIHFDFTVNVFPFVGMASDFSNACLNVLLFVPLGILLPMLWDKYRNMKSTLLFALCMTVGIEFSQIFTLRTTDINDIITNIAGTLLGYFVAKGITKNFTQCMKSNEKSKDLYMICGTVVLIMFLLQPFISSLLWEMIL